MLTKIDADVAKELGIYGDKDTDRGCGGSRGRGGGRNAVRRGDGSGLAGPSDLQILRNMALRLLSSTFS